MSTIANVAVLRSYWLRELHFEIQRPGSGLRSMLRRDDETGNVVHLEVERATGGPAMSVHAEPAPTGGWLYVDEHGHRIASTDDRAVATWDVRARF